MVPFPAIFYLYSAAVQRALHAGAAALEKTIESAIRGIIGRMAVDARIGAPKAHSHLAKSINATQISPLEGIVAPGVNYARMVEEGTGEGGRPPLRVMLDWVRVLGIQPRDPAMSDVDLAFVIAQSIAETGTPPQPYLQPAFDKNRPRATQLLDRAIDLTLQAMGRA